MTGPPDFETLCCDELDDGVLLVTLDRPDVRNAINATMHAELAALMTWLRSATEVGAVVLTGAGKVFSAGGDIDLVESYASGDWRQAVHLSDQGLDLLRDLLSLRVPAIAAVNGHAMGLGATLALLCDIVIMADGARIADTHVNVGIVAGDGGTLIWPMLIGPNRAKELLMTGDPVDAATAERLGLVNHVEPTAEVLPKALALAERLSRGPRQAIAYTKQAVNAPLLASLAVGLPLALAWEGMSLMQPDVKEGLTALRERRAPDFASQQSHRRMRE